MASDDDDDEYKHPSSVLYIGLSPEFVLAQPMPVALDLEPSCKKKAKR